MLQYQNQTIVVLGQRGTGKTTWVFRNLKNLEPYIIVDPVYDIKYQKLIKDHKMLQLKTVDESLKIFKYGNPQRCYISPNGMTFDFFCMILMARRNMNIIIDECDHYATSYFISPNFKKLINMGRHRNIGIVAICRRPKNMSPILRNQGSRFILFQMTGEDAKDCLSYVGSDVCEQLPNLKTNSNESEYIDYDFKTRTYEKKIILMEGGKRDSMVVEMENESVHEDEFLVDSIQ